MDLVLKTDRGVQVVLSKRNLLTLLHKVDDPTSARTLVRRTSLGLLVVRVEPDEDHYRDHQPGKVIDASEKFLAARGGMKL